MIPWVTRQMVWPWWAARSATRPASARLRTAPRFSAPVQVASCGVSTQARWASAKRSRTSSRVRPSHSPKPISRKAAASWTARRCGAAMMAAVSRARASGLDHTASSGVAASRRAADSACSRPVADSGTSRPPWKRRSRFQSVSA